VLGKVSFSASGWPDNERVGSRLYRQLGMVIEQKHPGDFHKRIACLALVRQHDCILF
jgi:hypothetical protein